jgi:hypothetical protein
MDFQALPRYRGPRNSVRGWTEPDERGKTPPMRLRDYLVLSLILGICSPIALSALVDQWVTHRRLVLQNSLRDEFVWKVEAEP